MEKLFYHLIFDRTEGYSKTIKPLTLLLGKEFYPNAFWDSTGKEIIICTKDDESIIKEKINLLIEKYKKSRYRKVAEFNLVFENAYEWKFEHPFQEGKFVNGPQLFYLNMKRHLEFRGENLWKDIGVQLNNPKKVSDQMLNYKLF